MRPRRAYTHTATLDVVNDLYEVYKHIFYEKKITLDGPTKITWDGRTYKRTDIRTDGRTDGRMDGQTDGRKISPFYRTSTPIREKKEDKKRVFPLSLFTQAPEVRWNSEFSQI